MARPDSHNIWSAQAGIYATVDTPIGFPISHAHQATTGHAYYAHYKTSYFWILLKDIIITIKFYLIYSAAFNLKICILVTMYIVVKVQCFYFYTLT